MSVHRNGAAHSNAMGAMTAIDVSLPAASRNRRFLGLALGSAGVVYGDIGTSPLYAFKESVAPLRGASGALAAADVIGVISLMFWTLMVIVTIKYVLILSRFDNKGEGGTLALMALVRRAGGRGAGLIMLTGMLGAGLFFGDALLTPAISVLSAVEGLSVIDALHGKLDSFVVPIALTVLAALFLAQRHGTAGVGRWFGPVCIVWFVTLAALGVPAIGKAPEILAAFNPLAAFSVIGRHPWLAPAMLGGVFLTVTGAEALYADMGHFGRKPIQATWLALVFPCLTLNYLGQGALVLSDPAAAENPFFHLAPAWFQAPLVVLATLATVIASQAVISGAFSLAQQAVQLGLLPRMTLKPTSEDHAGQIYAPAINWVLLSGVAFLVLAFGSSTSLAAAYGLSVVGAMITSSVLAVVAIHRLKQKSIGLALLLFLPFLLIEGLFTAANLTKVTHGGYVPLLIAACAIAIMGSWVRGVRVLAVQERRDLKISELLAMLADRPPMRARGTAVFLTTDPEAVPAALLHNLKHNQVLHEEVVLLTVKTAPRPRVPDAERVELTELAPGLRRLALTFGFMESPNVARGLSLARAHGLKFDIMRTSFFLSRRSVIPNSRQGAARLLDLMFVFLMRNSTRAADFFHLPPSRVVELGAQVML